MPGAIWDDNSPATGCAKGAISFMSTPPRDRPLGQTSGSDQRPARELTGAVMDFDISTELATLEQEPSWQRGDRNARTLVEKGGIRLVLTALKMGARLREHQTPGWVSIHAIAGHLRIGAGGRKVTFPPDMCWCWRATSRTPWRRSTTAPSC